MSVPIFIFKWVFEAIQGVHLGPSYSNTVIGKRLEL